MPTTALDIRDQVANPRGRFQLLINGSPLIDNQLDYQIYTAQRTVFRKKPATVVNPFRKDGTRPPSAYRTEWLRSAPSIPATYSLRWDFSNVQKFVFSDVPSYIVTKERAGHSLEQITAGLMQINPWDELGADGEARTKTLGKLSQKKWDLGVAALELKQTIGLVTQLARSTTSALDSLINLVPRQRKKLNAFFREVRRHDDFYRAASRVGLKDTSLLEDLKNGWMSYSFGVKPLVSDVHNAGTYLSDLLFKEQLALDFTVRAGAQRRSDHVNVQTDPFAPVRHHLFGEREVRVHYAVRYDLPMGGVGPVSELGLDNPLSIAYEGTRLSWLFDYVWDWGSWLESLTAARGLVFREGTRSILKRTRYNRVVQEPTQAGYVASSPSGPVYVDVGVFERVLLPSSGLMPAMLPSFRNSIGLVQMGQSLFALSDLLGGKPGLR